MAWAYLCGFVDSKALLPMALVSFGCTISYLGAAISLIKLGNLVGGVTWLYLASFFGFANGLTYALYYFAPIYNWAIDSRILGYVWAILGVMLIFTTPVFLKFAPASGTIALIGSDIGLCALALVYLGYSSKAVVLTSAWGFFVAGFFGVIMAGGLILNSVGIKFPMGRIILK
jgi:hypothetical protein